MFDPDDIYAPDIFGDLGRDAMKVIGPLSPLLLTADKKRPSPNHPLGECLRAGKRVRTAVVLPIREVWRRTKSRQVMRWTVCR